MKPLDGIWNAAPQSKRWHTYDLVEGRFLERNLQGLTRAEETVRQDEAGLCVGAMDRETHQREPRGALPVALCSTDALLRVGKALCQVIAAEVHCPRREHCPANGLAPQQPGVRAPHPQVCSPSAKCSGWYCTEPIPGSQMSRFSYGTVMGATWSVQGP